MDKGAVWTNNAWGKIEEDFQGSHVSHFVGSSSSAFPAIINQNDANNITVDNYSGHTTVIYKHDGAAPDTINGGSFHIINAAKGSEITLLTDNKGISAGFKDNDSDADKMLVANVMEKLANKLYYTNYADGNLTGYVKIADGLTASSKSLLVILSSSSIIALTAISLGSTVCCLVSV